MKQTLLILFLTIFTLQSWGFDHTITDKCRISMLEREMLAQYGVGGYNTLDPFLSQNGLA